MSIVDRVNLTSSCRDCDVIEKFPMAGQVFNEGDKKLQYMFNGIKIYYDSYHSPWMNDIIQNLQGHHEPQEEICFYNLLKTLNDNANMIELGSNWSYYSIWFNKQIKNPFNLCIEPVLDNLIKGKKNSQINDCKNIDFLTGCVSDKYLEEFNFKNWDNSVVTITQYSLDYLINKYDRFFDIVHSDIQGYEIEMLRGAASVLDKIGYFIISTHGRDELGTDTQAICKKFLQENNFTILIEHSISESFSADGLIVAVNKSYEVKYQKKIDKPLLEYFSKIKMTRR